MREAAEIMGEPDARQFLALALAGAALQLQIHLVDHPQPRRADRMAETFQPAVDLAGQGPLGVVETVEHVEDRAALGGNMQVFHGHQFGHGKTVMHFDQVDLFAGVGDPGFAIGARGGDAGGGEIAAVPGVMLRLDAIGDGDLQGLDGDEVVLAERTGDLGRRHDGAGRAVRHAAAIVKPERLGDGRRVQAPCRW